MAYSTPFLLTDGANEQTKLYLLVVSPLVIKLFWEVTLCSKDGCHQSVWIKGKLYTQLTVEVNKWLGWLSLILDWILSADLSH